MTTQRKLRVLILASHFRADHVAQMKPYRALNKAASTWNNALFAELHHQPLELHILQFYPVLKNYTFQENNVTYHYLPRIPKIDSFTSLAKRARVKRFAKKLQPDLIHGIGSEHGLTYAAVFKEWPSVITIHGYMKHIIKLAGHQDRLKELFLVREEAKALLQADAVIAINDFMRDKFIQEGCPKEKITIIPNALNPIYLTTGPATAQRPIDIIIVGTIHRLKNQHVALSILHEMKDKLGLQPSVKIAGAPTNISHDYYEGLLDFKEKSGLTNVEFLGSVVPDHLKELYCHSKILLHISEFETDSMVISEAMACGCLPVVNPAAGLAYRVQDNRNGFHIHIKDIEVAARELRDLLGRYDTLKPMAESSRKQIIAERAPQQVAWATVELYRSMSAIEKNKPFARPAG